MSSSAGASVPRHADVHRSDCPAAGQGGVHVSEGNMVGSLGGADQRNTYPHPVVEAVETLTQPRESLALGHRSVASTRVGPRNEVPSRHLPNSNSRPPTTRSGPPNRALAPVQGGPHAAENASVVERAVIPSAREETIELRALPAPVQPAGPLAPEPATTADRPWPSRPAPDDAAAAVWALVERAQAGDGGGVG